MQLAQAQNKLLIDFDDYEAITTMDKNIRLHPTAKLFIGRPKPKMAVVWNDRESGFLLKAQFDDPPHLS